MSSEAFRNWRKERGWRQKEAAEQLGLKKRMIQYYETGVRDGKKVSIPRYIRLACAALSAGINDFDGEATRGAPIPDTARSGGGENGAHAGNGSANGTRSGNRS
ncbi:MAG: helix-turn-helix transcriptional regulator [Pseudomonadota bacterium]